MDKLAIEELVNQLSIDECDELKGCINEAVLRRYFFESIKTNLIDIKSEKIICPVCGCIHIVKNGFDQFGDQRYLCKNEGCKRKSFSLKADTLMYYSKSSPEQWMLFFECLFQRDTISRTMEKVGVCENTVLLWRHKTMHLINKLVNNNKLEGLVYLDETLVNIGEKGIVDPKIDTKILKRGISSNKINIACAIDEHNNTVIKVSDVGRITSSSLINIYDEYIDNTNIVVSDSLRSYHQLFDALKCEWIKIPSGKKSYNGYTLTKVNHLHGEIKRYLGMFRGVSTHYLQGYMSLFALIRRYQRYYYPNIFRTLVKIITSSKMTLRCYDFNSTYSYS